MKTMKKIGKVILALIAAALMPVLIWVALGAAICHALKTHRAQKLPTWEKMLAGIKMEL